jgi:flagellar basal-body rod modification protein FlgD
MEGISPTSAQFFGVAKAKPKSQLNMEGFLKLLAVQMANQNPLEPMSDRDYFAQLAQLGQVQGSDTTNKRLETIQASSMIGMQVVATRGLTDEGSGGFNGYVSGTVAGMTERDGKFFLNIREANGGIVDVEFNNIKQISAAPAQNQTPINNQPQSPLLQASSLIGKSIDAKITAPKEGGGTTEVDIQGGGVVGAKMIDNMPYLRVKFNDSIYDVRLDQVRSVS